MDHNELEQLFSLRQILNELKKINASVQDIAEAQKADTNQMSYDITTEDEIYEKTKKLVINNETASASFLQRHLKIGYARAARLL